MAIKNRPTQLNGINPLSYVGVNPYTPPAMYQLSRPPTVRDNAGFQIGDFWMNDTNNDLWYLAKKSNPPQYQDALWVLLNNGADLETLTGDVGGPVGPDANRNIDTLGTAGEILVTGTPGTNTLTWSLDGSVALEYPTDAGTAVPSANVLNIITDNAAKAAGASVLFTGVGNTVQLQVTETGTNNTFIGRNAGNLLLNPVLCVNNTATGGNAHAALTDGLANCAYGVQSSPAITTGEANVSMGAFSLRAGTICGHNNAIGYQSLQALTSGINNCGYGSNSLGNLLTGNGNISIGVNSATAYVGAESSNITIGTNTPGQIGENKIIRIACGTAAAATDNIFIGNSSGNNTYTIATAVLNIGIGSTSLSALTTGSQNTCLGAFAGAAITTGIGNTLLGVACGDAITTGDSNTAVGLVSLTAMIAGVHNTAIGTGSLGTSTAGDRNTALGYYSGNGLLTGSDNILIGNGAGANYTGAESYNIIIGPSGGIVGDNNTMRLASATGGGADQVNRTFIHGIRGITTGVNDAIPVLIDSAGQLGTTSSSIRYKENVEDMGDYSSGLLDLRPVIFNYKEHPGHTETGLIAEEVADILPELVVYKDGQPETVKYHLLVNYLINELQKLERRVIELESK